MPPETRYAKSGDVHIAYQAVGQGAFDLVFVPGFISNLDLQWEDPGYSHLLKRLSAFSRLIQFDKRGTGLSDRVDATALPSLETRMDDVRAVMDAAGSGRAAIFGASEGAPMAILFAATYPERTRALVLFGGYAHFQSWVIDAEALEKFVETAAADWGSGATLKSFAPGRVDDRRFTAWWARFERLSASPAAAVALARMNATIDVRGVLSAIRVPTLLIHRTADASVNPDGSRYLREKIPGARLVEIPGRDHAVWTGDVDHVADVIEEFLTGTRPAPEFHRVLASLLVSRIAGVEKLAARFGDRDWARRTEMFRSEASAAIERLGGRSLRWDDARATVCFDGPARATKAALALAQIGAEFDLPLAHGVHVGEVEARGEAVRGLAVRVAERIASAAGPGEIVASSLVQDLCAGSGLHFSPRGTIEVDGLDHPLPLVSLVTEQHLEPAARKTGPTIEVLTIREREILGLVSDGMSNPAMAARLGLSEHTVKRHVANILLKLDLPSRSAAAALAGRRPGL